ncbi:MAG: acyl-CoA desaturase [Bacteroidetes bacterium]|jgi:linoleoyl-CoA desaturase|nr:acyl-CoA desaturase [Bacteroidota bacterium]
MQTIKFNTSNLSEKQFVQELRKRVSDYFKLSNISPKANTAMIIKTIVLLSAYLAPFVLILFVPMNPWIAFALMVLMGFGIAGIGMGVMHDACHGAYSRKKWVNDLLAGSLYLLGSNVLNWKIQHNVLHHTYTNISGLDEDIDDKGPIRLSENKPLKPWHKYQYLYAFAFYGLMTITMLTNDFTRLWKYHKAGLIKGQQRNMTKEVIKMMVRKVIYLSLIIGLPLWLRDFSLWQVLLGFFVMHWTASIILSFVFQMAHVVEEAEQPVLQDHMQHDWSVHQMNTTADFAQGHKLLGWYVGGLNFQVEHHLFPTICHVHYKAIAPIVEKTAKEFGIRYNVQPSFSSALLSHIYRLKELGKA